MFKFAFKLWKRRVTYSYWKGKSLSSLENLRVLQAQRLYGIFMPQNVVLILKVER